MTRISSRHHGVATQLFATALAFAVLIRYAHAESSTQTNPSPVLSPQFPVEDQDTVTIIVTHPDGTVTFISDPSAVAQFNADHMVDGKLVSGKDAAPGYKVVERRTRSKVLDRRIEKITVRKSDGSVTVITDPTEITKFQANNKNDRVIGGTTTTSGIKSISYEAPDGTSHTLTDPAEIAQFQSNPEKYAKTQSQTSTRVIANLSPEQLNSYLASGAHVNVQTSVRVIGPDGKTQVISDPAEAQVISRLLKDHHIASASYYMVGPSGEKTPITDPSEIANIQKATDRALSPP